jgi:hypothetical protein
MKASEAARTPRHLETLLEKLPDDPELIADTARPWPFAGDDDSGAL